MGLGGLKSAWQRQTLHFGHERRDQYSVLIMDNRGMGDSDKPLVRYSSSEMARDWIEVLSQVGWLPTIPSPHGAFALPTPLSRNLHILGISMGGMIAQEFACMLPDAISSLSFVSTAAVIVNDLSFREDIEARLSVFVPRTVDASLHIVSGSLFNRAWLTQPEGDDLRLPDPATTPKCLPPGPHPDMSLPYDQQPKYLRFDNNMQRFIAQEIHKRLEPGVWGFKGFMLQLLAAIWHQKSEKQLKAMADRVGRHRIAVIHGADDGMIKVSHGRKLISYLGPGLAKGVIVKGMGHAPMVERTTWFNQTIEEMCELGEKLDGRA